uniref:NADH-ubiquinone oxidoreductase chain 6 n=1 Tax=Nitidulidae sp. BMNH 1274727 TaxID=1796524 RepID=A0A126TGG1_9CUCU|nr:NADH dehydrogenase subunit 6 [Nitidulidae sp. BMNH 1274727]
MNLLIILSLTTSAMFLFLYHPLSLGFALLIQTILVSLITGILNYNFWFSYILFLIMIGGMLILFIYMTSISSNKKFKFSIKLSLIPLLFIMMFIIMMFMDPYFFNNMMLNINTINLMTNNNLSMSKFMNYPNNLILFMLYMYLFITLIAVSKISGTSSGPLRQKF